MLSSLKAHGDQGEVSDNLRKVNIAYIFKVQKDDPGYYRPVIVGKSWSKTAWNTFLVTQRNKVTGSSQQGFTRVKHT